MRSEDRTEERKKDRGRERIQKKKKSVRAKSILFPVMCMTRAAWVKGVFFCFFSSKNH